MKDVSATGVAHLHGIPLGSHVGAQLLVCFCIFNVGLMMTA